jgi:hypothetical protein
MQPDACLWWTAGAPSELRFRRQDSGIENGASNRTIPL